MYEKVDSKIYHATDIRRRDFVDYPFVLDEQVVGKWKYRDLYVYDFEERFDPNIQNWPKDGDFVESITFYSDGRAERVQNKGVIKMERTKGILLKSKENSHLHTKSERLTELNILLSIGNPVTMFTVKCQEFTNIFL